MGMAILKNQAQVSATEARIEELRTEIDATESAAERAGLESFIETLNDQIAEYEVLRVSSEISFRDLDELGELAIKARIAAGLTQQELAELLGVSQQQVQKDEATSYETVSLSKWLDVLDVLSDGISGSLLIDRNSIGTQVWVGREEIKASTPPRSSDRPDGYSPSTERSPVVAKPRMALAA